MSNSKLSQPPTMLETAAKASLLACLIVTAACDRPAESGLPGGVPFLERDSAGVLVATTLGTRARAPIGWVGYGFRNPRSGRSLGRSRISSRRSREHGSSRTGGLWCWTGRAASCASSARMESSWSVPEEGARGLASFDTGTTRRCYLVPSPGNDSLRAFDGARLSLFDDRGRFSHRFPVSWRDRPVARVRGVAGERVLVEHRLFTTSQEEGVPGEPSTSEFALLELERWRAVWEGLFQGRQDYTIVDPNSF